MLLNLNVPVTNRKGEVFPTSPDPNAPTMQLADVVAAHLEVCPDKNVPTRKYMNWITQLDQNKTLNLNPQDQALFEQALEATALWPAIKIQVFKILDATAQPNAAISDPKPVIDATATPAPAVADNVIPFQPER